MNAPDQAFESAVPRAFATRTVESVSLRALSQCAVAATVVWCVLFYFGRRTSYAGDDVTVLRPLFEGGLWQSLHRFLRPFEYLAAFVSYQAHFPVWLIISLLAYIAMTLGARTLLSSTTTVPTRSWWVASACACTPLAAQAYFQIDTVSQALANAFSIGVIVCTVYCLSATELEQIRRWSWRTVALAACCILSKETSYGIVALSSVLMLLRHRRHALVPALCMQALLFGAVTWAVFNTYDVTDTTSQYGRKTNPLYWLAGIIISMGMAVTPLPTSIVLSGAFLRDNVLMLIAVAGLLVTLLAAFALVPPLAALKRYPRALLARIRKRELDTDHVLLMFLACSVVPSILLKTGELYASQMAPLVAVILIRVSLQHSRVSPGIVWPALCAGWLAASAVNLMYYSVVTGFEVERSGVVAVERRLYESMQDGARQAPAVYSIYTAGIYEFSLVDDDGRTCRVSARQPEVCLPADIVSGFPRKR